MPRKALRPTVKRSGYTTPAIPQRTPERGEKKKKDFYTVVGPRAVFGIEPGDSGELELTKGQALALIRAGHLQKVDEPDTSEESPQDHPGKPGDKPEKPADKKK